MVHLMLQAGTFLVGVALGKKAIAAAEAAGIASVRTLEIVAAAPKYAEGRGVRYPVASDADLAVVKAGADQARAVIWATWPVSASSPPR